MTKKLESRKADKKRIRTHTEVGLIVAASGSNFGDKHRGRLGEQPPDQIKVKKRGVLITNFGNSDSGLEAENFDYYSGGSYWSCFWVASCYFQRWSAGSDWWVSFPDTSAAGFEEQ